MRVVGSKSQKVLWTQRVVQHIRLKLERIDSPDHSKNARALVQARALVRIRQEVANRIG